MEEWTTQLEEELSDAVEVKNPKSLHRYIRLLSENIVERKNYDGERDSIRGDLKEMMVMMRERFEAIDKRFEAVDKRFEDMQHFMNARFEAVDKRFEDMQNYMNARFEAVDKRFDDVNKRFTSLTWLISVGFVVVNVLIVVFKFFYP